MDTFDDFNLRAYQRSVSLSAATAYESSVGNQPVISTSSLAVNAVLAERVFFHHQDEDLFDRLGLFDYFFIGLGSEHLFLFLNLHIGVRFEIARSGVSLGDHHVGDFGSSVLGEVD